MGPKMDSLSLRYFGLPPAQPLRLALVDQNSQQGYGELGTMEQVDEGGLAAQGMTFLRRAPDCAHPTCAAFTTETREQGERRVSQG